MGVVGGIVLVFAVQVWTPVDNIKFETLSYLPPLTPDQIASQIDYMLANKWIPCLEFDLVSWQTYSDVVDIYAFWNLCSRSYYNGSDEGSDFDWWNVSSGWKNLPHQFPGFRILWRSLLDHVEVAHVRMLRCFNGVARDRGMQEGVPWSVYPGVGIR